MGKLYLATTFSLKQLPMTETTIHVEKIDKDYVVGLSKSNRFMSVINDPQKARLINKDLSLSLESNDILYKFRREDVLIVAQYRGPELSEMAEELPEGGYIQYWLINHSL